MNIYIKKPESESSWTMIGESVYEIKITDFDIIKSDTNTKPKKSNDKYIIIDVTDPDNPYICSYTDDGIIPHVMESCTYAHQYMAKLKKCIPSKKYCIVKTTGVDD